MKNVIKFCLFIALVITIQSANAQSYCTLNTQNSGSLSVQSFKYYDKIILSSANNHYDTLNQTISMYPENTLFSIFFNESSSSNLFAKIWIDMNGDFLFDASEIVMETSGSQTDKLVGQMNLMGLNISNLARIRIVISSSAALVNGDCPNEIPSETFFEMTDGNFQLLSHNIVVVEEENRLNSPCSATIAEEDLPHCLPLNGNNELEFYLMNPGSSMDLSVTSPLIINSLVFTFNSVTASYEDGTILDGSNSFTVGECEYVKLTLSLNDINNLSPTETEEQLFITLMEEENGSYLYIQLTFSLFIGCCSSSDKEYTNNISNGMPLLPSFTGSNTYINAGGATTSGESVIVQSGDNCVFRAANHILLKPGFTAESSSSFRAFIQDDCMSFGQQNAISQVDVEHENEEAIDLKSSIKIFPNPFSDITTLNYQVFNETEVAIHLYDIYGKKVTELLTQQIQDNGNYSIVIEQPLAKGAYYCLFKINNKVFTKMIVKN